MASVPFKHTIIVQTADIDHLGHANNVVYVRWIQEVAAAHWEAMASPSLKDKYAWVILRHEIDYRNPAFLHDEIVGSTWIGEHHGPRFERYVKLTLAKNQKVVAEAKTIWCLLDAASMRPIRIPQEMLAIL